MGAAILDDSLGQASRETLSISEDDGRASDLLA